MDKAKKHWDEVDIQKVRDVSWLGIPYFGISHMKRLGAGNVPAFIGKYLQQFGTERNIRGAAIVCGDMAGERHFFETTEFVQFKDVDGFDISEASIKRYKPTNIQFHPNVMDCNDLVLKKSYYDLIVCSHGLHHIYNVGGVTYQIHKGLKDHGIFYLYEWIGPEYLQIPKINHIIAAFLLFSLFPKAIRTTHMGRIKARWIQEKPEAFDPSEACNSTEIVPQFEKYFNPITKIEMGGLCYPIFEGIAQNLKPDDWRTRFVYWAERVLGSLKIIKPLFMIAIAKKKNMNIREPMDRSNKDAKHLELSGDEPNGTTPGQAC